MKEEFTDKIGNFDTTKWFKKQYLEEAGLGPEQMGRLYSTANMKELRTLHDMLRIVSADWMQKGIEKSDIKEYINHFIDKI